MAQILRVTTGMRVRLRKKHPCGGDEWIVRRSGADIGIECVKCRRRVLLDRETFERRTKSMAYTVAESDPGETCA